MEYVLTILSLPDLGVRRLGKICRGGFCHIKDHFIPHARNNYHPHILGDRAIGLFSGLLIAVKFSILIAASVGPVLPAFSSAITVSNIISLTNQSRTDYNLGALKENAGLNKAAQAKADDMLAKGYFSHTTPEGKTPWIFIEAAGYNYIMAGENLAVNFTEAENVETAWMNSPGHKANILNKNFEEIGIGISQGLYQGHEAVFVVQMFGAPAEQKITVTNTPTPVLIQSVPAPTPTAALKITAPKVASASNQTPKDEPVLAAAPEEARPIPLAISGEQVLMQDSRAIISANFSGNTVKAIAYFGQKAIMLLPKGGNVWEGSAPLSDLSNGNIQVRLKAFDILGATTEKQLADFSNSTVKNYNVSGAENNLQLNWFGRTFDPKIAQDRFYMIFIATMLASMILAIGLKRHIQHLNLVANSSFVVILATLLWFAG